MTKTGSMVNISVCLETVFPDLPVEERIARIAETGFQYVEFWHPEATFDGQQLRFDQPKNPDSLREVCHRYGVKINDFALHAWDGSIGGCPVRSADRQRYLEQVEKMIAFARRIDCTKLITLSGTGDGSQTPAAMRQNLEEALAEAIPLAASAGMTLLLEPLNTLVDHPGYFLNGTAEAAAIVRTLNSPSLKLLYDIYHMQIMEGKILTTIEQHIDMIGHFHSAGVPGRAELFGGELNYPAILQRIESLGYQGCFGLEYFPRMTDHRASLEAIGEYLSQMPR